MLMLQRKKGESIRLNEDIRITVTEISRDSVRISIDAPAEVKVLREELYTAARVNRESALENSKELERFLNEMNGKDR